MKKYIIPVALFLVVVIGSIIFGVSMSYKRVQYGKETSLHVARVHEGGELIAEYDGVTTKVVGQNVDRLMKAIIVTETEHLVSRPEFDRGTSITLKFPDGATYIIAHDDSCDDRVFVIYSYKGKEYYTRTEGYNSFSWVERAISPQGIYNENILVD